jgi:hypothetical protein
VGEENRAKRAFLKSVARAVGIGEEPRNSIRPDPIDAEKSMQRIR